MWGIGHNGYGMASGVVGGVILYQVTLLLFTSH
jgi:hypothetical protein